MGGNDCEWTTEASSVSGEPYVTRGGNYATDYSYVPAGYRDYFTTSDFYDYIGFRTTLYM